MAHPAPVGPELESRLLSALTELEQRLAAGTLEVAEDLRDTFPDVWANTEAALELIYAEYVLRAGRGEHPNRDDWYCRFPQWRDRLERLFAIYDLGVAPEEISSSVPDRPAEAGYELLGEIGRGGMGVVYKARQITLNRIVALKMLRGGGQFRPEDAARIGREAEAVARLQHPNIVQIFETGEFDGCPFLALEFVAGGSLEDALSPAQRKGSGPVTATEAAALVETLARAVDHAHRHGIVHRDLKPANILLAVGSGPVGADSKDQNTKSDSASPHPAHSPLSARIPKIADFGLAVIADGPAGATRTGTVVGTPSYMAPEQTRGLVNAVGPPADVYALGGILYRMLAGRPPFEGGTALETLDLVRHAEPVPPSHLRPNLPRDLEIICLKCLRKEPTQRYATAAELADDLRRFLDGRPILARPVPAWEKAVKWVRRNPAVTALSVCVVAVVIGAFWVTLFQLDKTRGALHDKSAALEQVDQARKEAVASQAGKSLALVQSYLQANQIESARKEILTCPEEHRGPEWIRFHAECFAELRRFEADRRPDGSRFNGWVRWVLWADDRRLVGCAANGEILVWDVVTGSLLRQFRYRVPTDPPASGFAVDRERQQVVVVRFPTVPGEPYRTPEVCAFNLNTGDLLLKVSVPSTPQDPPLLSASGREIVKYTRNFKKQHAELIIQDFAGGKERRWTFDSLLPQLPYRLTSSDDGRTMATIVTKEPDEKRIRAFRRDREIDLCGLPDGWRQEGHIALSPDGRFLAFRRHIRTPGLQKVVEIWDLDETRKVREISQDFRPGSNRPGNFGLNGALFAWEGEGNRILVGRTEKGEPFLTLRGHLGPITTFEFSPDGTRLATCSEDLSVRVWNVIPPLR